jgi:MFS transporter, DHA1 family, multidrug resistance protein
MLAYTTFTAVFGSSIFSAGILTVSAKFHVGREVGTLGTSLYVLGKSPLDESNLPSVCSCL